MQIGCDVILFAVQVFNMEANKTRRQILRCWNATTSELQKHIIYTRYKDACFSQRSQNMPTMGLLSCFIQPTKYSSLCSVHFEELCYYRRLAEEGSGYRVLERGSVPTKDISFMPENENNEITVRGKRKVSRSQKICITRIICISHS